MLNPEKIIVSEREGIPFDNKTYSSIVYEIEKIVESADINIVFTHSCHDNHQDHRILSDITVTALRRKKVDIFFYITLANDVNFKPNLFIDITDVFEYKKRALAQHTTQKEKSYMSDTYLEILHSDSYAALHGLRYSEKYEIGQCFF